MEYEIVNNYKQWGIQKAVEKELIVDCAFWFALRFHFWGAGKERLRVLDSENSLHSNALTKVIKQHFL